MKIYAVLIHCDYEGFKVAAHYVNRKDAEIHLSDLETCISKSNWTSDSSVNIWWGRADMLGGRGDRFSISEYDLSDNYQCPYGNIKGE